MFYNAEATIDGKLHPDSRFRCLYCTCESRRWRRLANHVSEQRVYGCRRARRSLEHKENRSLQICRGGCGKFDDMTKEQRRFANKKNNTLRKLERRERTNVPQRGPRKQEGPNNRSSKMSRLPEAVRPQIEWIAPPAAMVATVDKRIGRRRKCGDCGTPGGCHVVPAGFAVPCCLQYY